MASVKNSLSKEPSPSEFRFFRKCRPMGKLKKPHRHMLKGEAEIRIKYPLSLETIIKAKKLEKCTIEDSESEDDGDCYIEDVKDVFE